MHALEKNLTAFFPLTGPEDSLRPPPTGEKRRQEDEHTEDREEQGEAVMVTGFLCQGRYDLRVNVIYFLICSSSQETSVRTGFTGVVKQPQPCED